jgi:hypothetical protein
MFSYFVYISFHPCQIPKNYGFKLELLPGPKTGDATYLSMIYVAFDGNICFDVITCSLTQVNELFLAVFQYLVHGFLPNVKD